MDTMYEALLFYDELPDAQQRKFREQLDDNPELAEGLRQWRAVCDRVRERFRADLPDCRLLVLYALDTGGRADPLTDDEQAALADARPSIEAAIEAHPALQNVVERIQEEQADFEALWDDHNITHDPSPGDATVEPTTASNGAPARDGRARTDRGPRRSASRNDSQRWLRRVAAAAVLLAAAALVVFMWPRESARTTIEVAEGEARTVELLDGSVVRVVGESELSYSSSTGETFDRRLTLAYGRAFFEVQEQKQRTPFVVETPTATATVLGTQFGVEATAERTDVTLATGRVEVGTPDGTGETITLEPGQRSRVAQGSTPSAPERVNLTDALMWTGMFVFRATPMRTIAEQLQAHYDVPVAVDDALRDEAITGTFERSRPVREVLQAVAATLGAQVQGSAEEGFRLVPVNS